jgi:hypothetical protein
MSDVVFTSGPHAGLSVDDVVDLDPAYILWASENSDVLIKTAQYILAKRRLDEWNEDQIDPYDDFDYALSQATAFGYVQGADNE